MDLSMVLMVALVAVVVISSLGTLIRNMRERKAKR